MNKKPIVYYDMDDTLFNFRGTKEDMPKALEKMWEKGFFRNLRPMEGIEVVNVLHLLGYEAGIISACINSPYCKPEKMEVVKENFPTIKEENIILVEVGQNKADFVDPKGNILVDDYGKNLRDWEAKGGIPVKYSNSEKKRDIYTIRDHYGILDVLADLLEYEGE